MKGIYVIYFSLHVLYFGAGRTAVKDLRFLGSLIVFSNLLSKSFIVTNISSHDLFNVPKC
jgi:hypothetical protein